MGDAGREPMSEPQEKYLRHLCEQNGKDFDPTLSKEDARWAIREMTEGKHLHRGQVREVACPKCGVGAGSYCRKDGGGTRMANHAERVLEARKNPLRGSSTNSPAANNLEGEHG